MNQLASCISDFDQPISVAIQRLREVNDFDGNPSYQNALEIAKQQIEMNVPPYAFKELLLINSSITNCDPGNINNTIEGLKQAKITCSVISLSAAMHILQHLAKSTQGQFFTAIDKEHFEEITQKYLVPQFMKNAQKIQDEQDTAQLIKIAFHSVLFTVNDQKKPCNCHNKFVYQFLECPNCKGVMCLNNFFKENCIDDGAIGAGDGSLQLTDSSYLDSLEGNQIVP